MPSADGEIDGHWIKAEDGVTDVFLGTCKELPDIDELCRRPVVRRDDTAIRDLLQDPKRIAAAKQALLDRSSDNA